MFRTPEGFTTPWANWNPGVEPTGTAGDASGIDDCVMRHCGTGLWNDEYCEIHLNYYCETEGKL